MNDNEDNHLVELQRKHTDLDNEIEELQKLPLPDSLKLTSLKRRKLAAKDAIERYKRTKRTPFVHSAVG